MCENALSSPWLAPMYNILALLLVSTMRLDGKKVVQHGPNVVVCV